MQPSTIGTVKPAVVAGGLQKQYGSAQVLAGVDLRLDLGECLVVIGPSGGGKSTLLRCISGLERVEKGSITIHGVPVQGPEVRSVSKDARRVAQQKVGMIFQSFNLFPHMTAHQNVALALRLTKQQSKGEAMARAAEAIESVGLLARINAYPDELSGGQQQRLAIARAMVLRPDILLFDEPTSALDPELVGEVLRIMRELIAGGMSTIVVTHEMGFARDVADRVMFIADGEIAEEGPPEQVLSEPSAERTRQFMRRLLER